MIPTCAATVVDLMPRRDYAETLEEAILRVCRRRVNEPIRLTPDGNPSPDFFLSLRHEVAGELAPGRGCHVAATFFSDCVHLRYGSMRHGEESLAVYWDRAARRLRVDVVPPSFGDEEQERRRQAEIAWHREELARLGAGA